MDKEKKDNIQVDKKELFMAFVCTEMGVVLREVFDFSQDDIDLFFVELNSRLPEIVERVENFYD